MPNHLVECHDLDIVVCRHGSTDFGVGHLANVSPYDGDELGLVYTQTELLQHPLPVPLILEIGGVLSKLGSYFMNARC